MRGARGRSCARNSASVLCSDSARAGFTAQRGSRSKTRRSPTVENTRFLWPMSPSVPSSSIASSTLSRLCAGSPMPMNATFFTARRLRASATWATISALPSWRSRPSRPVMQKVQPTAQPTWVETQRPPRGSSTLSTAWPSASSSSSRTPSAPGCALRSRARPRSASARAGKSWRSSRGRKSSARLRPAPSGSARVQLRSTSASCAGLAPEARRRWRRCSMFMGGGMLARSRCGGEPWRWSRIPGFPPQKSVPATRRKDAPAAAADRGAGESGCLWLRWRAVGLRLDAEFGGEALAGGGLAAHEAAELRRRHVHRLGAHFGELLAHVGRGKRRVSTSWAKSCPPSRPRRRRAPHRPNQAEFSISRHTGFRYRGHLRQHRPSASRRSPPRRRACLRGRRPLAPATGGEPEAAPPPLATAPLPSPRQRLEADVGGVEPASFAELLGDEVELRRRAERSVLEVPGFSLRHEVGDVLRPQAWARRRARRAVGRTARPRRCPSPDRTAGS